MRRTPLKRGTVGLKRGRGLRQQSTKMREETAPADRAWSLAVRTRDDYRCRARTLVPLVGCSGTIHAHHVWPKEDFPHLRHEISNGLSLCEAHHRWVHDGDPFTARQLGLLQP